MAMKITRGKGEYWMMLKGSIHQEDITILNMQVPTKELW